ncbi:Glycerophosphoryl diester phosphodiesterase [Pseudomonas chlororaphis]|uniref:Glycerophosphoryl diester phosphodiesterase n=1 Tax=Pseudomonas chlororaphis TaxID=587753 RepID=A0A3G7TPH3_9PSED|nr:hypothetical protein [Pseudomonas chlororaphis]AZE48751.1 Glycerophosphoryl diester phosphodiesterase [Pseudomonas chlororaphis]
MQTLNAGWNFKQTAADGQATFPYRSQAVAQLLEQLHAWNRVLIYSTDASYQQALAHYPQARLFESRDKVRMLAIGVNTAEDYQAAACLKMDAVLVDSPRAMRDMKQRLERPLRCD